MSREVKAPGSAPRPRGRPPSARARTAILAAARQLLAEGGPGAVTMEGVATRAGVGKPTVYRWWPDRHAVTMAALMAQGDQGEPNRRPRSPKEALRRQLRDVVERFSTPVGRHVTAMLAASDSESELAKAFRNHFVLARRAEGRELLHQAIAAGELRRDVDIDVALDSLYGAVFFRLLLGHAPLDTRFADTALEQTFGGVAPSTRSTSSRPSRPRRVRR
jgi:AcrR family transcriptional regulator